MGGGGAGEIEVRKLAGGRRRWCGGGGRGGGRWG